jgi:hypothetical protein
VPVTIAEPQHLEIVFDVFYLYLGLSYRFRDSFPDHERMRKAQQQLDGIIHEGVSKITELIQQDNLSGASEDSRIQTIEQPKLVDLMNLYGTFWVDF